MSRASGRRGLLIVLALLGALLLVADLVRTDSIIRAGLRSLGAQEGAPVENMLRRLRGS